ncbi:probable glycosyltransferase At5g03795 isoform X1 [Chenopodium quinoa]|uniref:probable glycosyltransferase At5g03795 isoform X1 n=1 Tax=Chenopodium quinoa TaxID=63459 RepID=UPI000B7767B5|nr:probable glycosyltransferase At5g03795 isoform X1 [Chenopodium quinoa]
MEQVFKIYVYKEGQKPIFHQPGLTGIYAGEGWFMELIEKSTRFTVEDPKKAHLYYLPFGSTTLRWTLNSEKSHNPKKLEDYLKDYVDLIKNKYSYWNANGGADHFFVACHDWALRITRKHMSSCIRALCNANAARGFSIGKDVSVPVTFIHNEDDPLRDMGGKPPSDRDILAFFAGKMHGYLRPLLLKYWENKVSDMKIFGPMPLDIEGETMYKEYMKSSKYCICARGYQVHSPRVVESILYGCIPVIIADNYVPPFFDVLDWETFAVFVQEKDIRNLRSILLSISEDRYLDMHHNLKMVQRHFIWHKTPQKYDLFHMILHSLWSSRVSRLRPL